MLKQLGMEGAWHVNKLLQQSRKMVMVVLMRETTEDVNQKWQGSWYLKDPKRCRDRLEYGVWTKQKSGETALGAFFCSSTIGKLRLLPPY